MPSYLPKKVARKEKLKKTSIRIQLIEAKDGDLCGCELQEQSRKYRWCEFSSFSQERALFEVDTRSKQSEPRFNFLHNRQIMDTELPFCRLL